MLLSELYNILKLKFNGEDKYINNIVTNSEEVCLNDIFLCINSGYKYIKKAKENGCVGVIVDCDIEEDILTLRVNDSIEALCAIAKYKRDNYSGIIMAITGSTGKTTTKELLGFMLSKYNNVLISEKSYNNHIGIPNTLLKLNNDYNYVVLELGTNHRGEIKYLTDIVKPNISIITNIGYAHIGNFKTKRNILKEKKDIWHNILFVNGEDKYLNKLHCIKVFKDDYNYVPAIPSYKMNYNLVLKVLEYIGYKKEDIYPYIDKFKPIKSRMDIITGKIDIIDDSYNASYDSILCGIDYIKKYKRQIIVLSEMLEIGKYSNKLYKKLFKYIKDNLNNYIIITIGDSINKYSDIKCVTKLDIIKALNNINFINGDVIYIKGAHKYNLSSLIKDIEL